MCARPLVIATVAVAAVILACSRPRPADVFPSDTLAALNASFGVLDPPFDPEVMEYDLDMVVGETETTFTLQAVVPVGTSITIDGAAIDSGATSSPFALDLGASRDVSIVLTRAGGKIRTYVVHLHRGVDGLAMLVPSTGTLGPTFDPAVDSYAMGLHLDAANVAFTPTLLFPSRASVAVVGVDVSSGSSSPSIALTPGDNPIDVTVAPKTRVRHTYDVAVTRGIDALASFQLGFMGGPITNAPTPSFDPFTSSYTVDVGLWVQRLSISAFPFDSSATVTVAGARVPAGVESNPISLNLGLTSFPVIVRAADGAQKAYVVNVSRGGPVLQRAYAKQSNTGGDGFGNAVAIYGDTLVVGASGEASSATGVDGDQDDNSAGGSGAAYVFTRTSSGWSQEAYLKASNTGALDHFGSSVAIYGNTIVVGAPEEDSGSSGVGGDQSSDALKNAGAVYIFVRSGTSWAQQAYVKASNPDMFDAFGYSVALFEDTLAVGAPYEGSIANSINGDQTDNSRPGSGAAYVFTRAGNAWSQQAYVKASNSGTDTFATSLSLWNNTLAVGAPAEDSASTTVNTGENDDSAPDAGAAYVFVRNASTWTQQAYIKADNTDAGDRFGESVGLSGDTLVVGAPHEAGGGTFAQPTPSDDTATLAGAAYVFARTGTNWAPEIYLKAPNTDAGDLFGHVVAIWGDVVAVGAPNESSTATGIDGDGANNGAPSSGAVYEYTRHYSVQSGLPVWEVGNYLKASNSEATDLFGSSVGVWGDTLAGGAVWEDSAATGIGGDETNNAIVDSGAVYLFR